jgi:type IVB pilus formation R64 PilN family outer membrane protein
MLKRFLLLLLVSCFAMSLSACRNQETRTLIDQRKAEAEKTLMQARFPEQIKGNNPLTVTDKMWMGNQAMRMHRGQPLPARFESPKGMTVITGEGMTLGELASVISTQTGIPVRLGAGVTSGGSAMGSAMGGSSGAGAGASGAAFQIAYEGPLSNFLDQAAGFFGVNWRYDGVNILFTRFETRVFVMEALPGTQTVKDGMKEDNTSGATSGSVTTTSSSTSALQQTSEMNLELKFWDEIGQTVQAMLSGVGSVVVSPSAGTLTVTTTPDIMMNVADYLNQENRRLSRQIAINVEIYSVNLGDSDNFSMNFSTALRRLTNLGINVTSAGNPVTATGLGRLSVAILNPETVGSTSWLFDALSQVGDTTRIAQFPMTTLNNRPVSRRVGRDRSFLASAQINTSQSFQNTTLTPGVVREGFSLQLTPRLLDDQRILLQYSMSLVDIVQIASFQSGGSSIQLPETSNRIFVQQSMLRSGNTLVIGGFDEERSEQRTQGVGNPFNYLLGGGYSNSSARSMLFIAITPQELDVPRAEQG